MKKKKIVFLCIFLAIFCQISSFFLLSFVALAEKGFLIELGHLNSVFTKKKAYEF
jgi:hypothetical protein